MQHILYLTVQYNTIYRFLNPPAGSGSGTGIIDSACLQAILRLAHRQEGGGGVQVCDFACLLACLFAA